MWTMRRADRKQHFFPSNTGPWVSRFRAMYYCLDKGGGGGGGGGVASPDPRRTLCVALCASAGKAGATHLDRQVPAARPGETCVRAGVAASRFFRQGLQLSRAEGVPWQTEDREEETKASRPAWNLSFCGSLRCCAGRAAAPWRSGIDVIFSRGPPAGRCFDFHFGKGGGPLALGPPSPPPPSL